MVSVKQNLEDLVVLTGGFVGHLNGTPSGTPSSSVLIKNGTSNEFEQGPSMIFARAGHSCAIFRHRSKADFEKASFFAFLSNFT